MTGALFRTRAEISNSKVKSQRRERGTPPTTSSLRACREPGSFSCDVEAVGGETGGKLHLAARPSNREALHRRSVSEPEMYAQVVLREVAAAASHFSHLSPPAAFDD